MVSHKAFEKAVVAVEKALEPLEVEYFDLRASFLFRMMNVASGVGSEWLSSEQPISSSFEAKFPKEVSILGPDKQPARWFHYFIPHDWYFRPDPAWKHQVQEVVLALQGFTVAEVRKLMNRMFFFCYWGFHQNIKFEWGWLEANTNMILAAEWLEANTNTILAAAPVEGGEQMTIEARASVPEQPLPEQPLQGFAVPQRQQRKEDDVPVGPRGGAEEGPSSADAKKSLWRKFFGGKHESSVLNERMHRGKKHSPSKKQKEVARSPSKYFWQEYSDPRSRKIAAREKRSRKIPTGKLNRFACFVSRILPTEFIPEVWKQDLPSATKQRENPRGKSSKDWK